MVEDLVERVADTYDDGPFRVHLDWRPHPDWGWILLRAVFLPLWISTRDEQCQATLSRLGDDGKRQPIIWSAFSSHHAEETMSGGPYPLQRGFAIGFAQEGMPTFCDRSELLVSVSVTMEIRGGDPPSVTTTVTRPPYTAREVAEAIGLDDDGDE